MQNPFLKLAGETIRLPLQLLVVLLLSLTGSAFGQNFSNGGFENSDTSPSTWSMVAASSMANWDSANGFIEIWNDGFQGVAAVDGDQFIELEGSSVFQTFSTVPGTIINWAFSHRARLPPADDTVLLFIGAPGSESLIAEYSSPANQWTRYQGSTVVPAGQTQTTIRFTASTAKTVSSLLDAVALELILPSTRGELLVNGSFEDTGSNPSTWGRVNDATVPGWQADNGTIEVWHDGFQNAPAVDGEQLIEMDGAGVYQTFATVPGTSLDWSFYHRARSVGITDKTVTISLGALGAETLQSTYTSPSDQWTQYSGTYLVPAGQTQTSIRIAPTTGASNSGLLDQIQVEGEGGSSNDPVNPEGSMGAYLNGVFPSVVPGASVEGGEFTTKEVFSNLAFTEPLRVIEHPRANEVVVVDKEGEFWRFNHTNPNTNQRDLILDLSGVTKYPGTGEGGCTGFAFHPEFGLPGSPNRGYIYVAYRWSPVVVGNTSAGTDGFNRIARFTVADGETQADLDSELVLIQQYDRQQWHIGGHLFFGPDGFLYIALGDEGNSENKFYSTQRIDGGFWSGLLRIDVDNDPTKSTPIARQPREPSEFGDSKDTRPAGWPDTMSQGYSIPFDNPFVDQNYNPANGGEAANLEEYYSIGLRHPWTVTYDPVSGFFYYGDVGQGGFEEVGYAFKGSNHQWGYDEGLQVGNGPINKPNPVIGVEAPPALDYAHGSSRGSVISAGVYRGGLYPDLYGKHLFSDFLTGELWAMEADQEGPIRMPANVNENNLPAGVEYITQLPGGFGSGIGSYTTLRNGRILCVQSVNNGSIFELSLEGGSSVQPPALLSQTGAFSDLQNLTVASSQIIPYSMNVPFWSDNAEKFRWMAIPNDGTHNSPDEQVTIDPNGDFIFPVGSVSIKHFEMALNRNNPNATVPIETRFFVRTENDYYGVTYRWNEAGTDAELLFTGEERSLQITEPNGSTRNQIWEFPSRTDCTVCHTDGANGFLGPNLHQLNGDQFYGDALANQLTYWSDRGIFSDPITAGELPSILKAAASDDPSASIQDRARAYLDSNCAYCHNPEVGVRANFDARLTTSLEASGMINGVLSESLGIPGEAVIVPGDPAASIAYVRAHSVNESFSMPPLAKNLIDEQGAALLAAWILSLSDSLGNPTETAGNFTDSHHPSLYVNTSDTLVNSEADAVSISINFFKFRAYQKGNPVTPFVATMTGGGNAPEDFTVLAIGQTRQANEYNVGENTFTFGANGSTTITLGAGETLVSGFMDAFPDGTGWGGGSVIPAFTSGGQAEDDTYGLLPSPLVSQNAAYNPNVVVATIAEGETILETNADVRDELGPNRILQRSYQFQVSYTFGDESPGGPIDPVDPVNPVNPSGTELLVNGSFEDSNPNPNTFVIINPSAVPGWNSTESTMEFWADGFRGVDAFDGDQLAELNNIEWQQTVSTTPGTTLVWSFYHRGRITTDTMTLSLGAPGSEAVIETASTPPGAWVRYQGTYLVPAGQTTTSLVLDQVGSGNSRNLVDLVSLRTPGDGNGGGPIGEPSLLNGSFENGLANWSSDDVSLVSFASDGAQALDLKNGYIEQTLTGLTPGLVHTLHFAYRSQGGIDGFVADVDILINGNSIGQLHNRSTAYLPFNGFEFIPGSTEATLRVQSLEPTVGMIIDNLRLERGELPAPPRASSLQNGSFEDVTGLSGRNPHISGFQLPGWLVTQENVDPIQTPNFNGWQSFDGDWVLDLGGHGPGGIAQTVTGLNPGSSHTLSFAYARHRSWNQVQNLEAEVFINGVLVDTLVRNQSQAVPNWALSQIPATANQNGEITIEFVSTSITVGGGIILDDLQLLPANAARSLASSAKASALKTSARVAAGETKPTVTTLASEASTKLLGLAALLGPEGISVHWSASEETDVLGYQVWWGDEFGPRDPLDGFVPVGSEVINHYQISAAEPATHYWLQQISTGLDATLLASAWTALPSQPDNDPSDHDQIIRSVDGRAQIELKAGANVLVTGFERAPSVLDVPTGLQRLGTVVEIDTETAIYLGLPDGASILVTEE